MYIYLFIFVSMCNVGSFIQYTSEREKNKYKEFNIKIQIFKVQGTLTLWNG